MAKCPRFLAEDTKNGQNHENCLSYKKHMENKKMQQYNTKRNSIGFRFWNLKDSAFFCTRLCGCCFTEALQNPARKMRMKN